MRRRIPGAVCVLAILAQTVLPFAHAAFEGNEHPPDLNGSRAVVLEDGSATPDVFAHDASCPLCQFLAGSKQVAISQSALPRLHLEGQDVPRSDRVFVAPCRIDVRTAGPRGPPGTA